MLPLESVEYLKTRKYTAPHQGMHTAHAINCTHNCGRIKSTKWDNQWTSKSIKQLYLDQFFSPFWWFSASCSLHRFSFLVHGTRCCCLSTLALILFLQQVFRDSARWFFIVSWAFLFEPPWRKLFKERHEDPTSCNRFRVHGHFYFCISKEYIFAT